MAISLLSRKSMTNESTILNRFTFRIIAVFTVSLYVSELGSRQSIYERLLTKEFYYEYGVTFLIALTVTELIYRIDHFLSRRYPLHDHTGMRILLQVIFGLALPAIAVFLMAALYFGLNRINIFKTDYLVFVFPLVIVLLILLNLLFILVPYFVHAYRLQKGKAGQQPVTKMTIASEELQSFVKAYSGACVLNVKSSDINAAYIVGGKVVINVLEQGELITDYTLDDLDQILTEPQFFRINRQLIANKQVCKSYRSLEYGKLEVQIDPTPPVNPIVSQLKAKAFKQWIAGKM